MTRIGLLWRTVRHLTLRQAVYQGLHRLRGPATLHLPETVPVTYFLTFPTAGKPVSWQKGGFTFLNQSVQFDSEIDWNYAHLGKLWTYNLNYFDFLNQPGRTVEIGLELMHDFIAQTESLRDGLEAYPTSLRIINWIQFLSRHQIQDKAINGHLFAQTTLLRHRLEYHLAGNHLLENGFALLLAAVYFRHERWFIKAARLVRRELTRQILADGGHNERSPMYHQLLLDRLLDMLLILRVEEWPNDPTLVGFLTKKAACMLAWLNSITFRSGDVPLVNDAAVGIAPVTAQLRAKTEALLPEQVHNRFALTDSGYRMFRQKRYELVADVGPIGPDHQPGHAHADTFSFVLHVDNQPVIVDSGTSTYQIGDRRAWERSTAAHNTVTVCETNSSEVWAGFRVGRRARVTILADTETRLTAHHDGYQNLGIIHERTWLIESARFTILDRLLNARTQAACGQSGIARFYFHPTSQVQVLDDSIRAGSVKMFFNSVTKPKLLVTTDAIAEGFNRLQPGQCLEVAFTNRLETTIILSG